MSVAAKGIFVSESYDSEAPFGAVWVDGKLTAMGENAYSYSEGDYSIVNCDRNPSIYKTETGEKITDFTGNDSIVSITPPVIIAYSGSYICIYNMSGELVRGYLPGSIAGGLKLQISHRC